MYMLLNGDRALIIDPHVNEEALRLLKERGVTDVVILPTHEHYDHISGVNWFKENIHCIVIANKTCSERMGNPRQNCSLYFDVLFIFSSESKKSLAKSLAVSPFVSSADKTFENYECFDWCKHKVEIFCTPGHSEGSSCIVLDELHLFSGDSLIYRAKSITRLPGGSVTDYEQYALPFFRARPTETIIYPGHGNMFNLESQLKYLETIKGK